MSESSLSSSSLSCGKEGLAESKVKLKFTYFIGFKTRAKNRNFRNFPQIISTFPAPDIVLRSMRPLTEEETKTLFAKLASYIGRNITHLIDRPDDPHVFRLHKDRVYYVAQHIANLATSLPRQNLLSLGTCLGKFSKSGKFRLHVTALDFLAQHATYKVWVKPNGEMPFLYGNHVLKAHVGRITQDTPEHQGVVVYSMSDIPLVCLFYFFG